MKKILRIILLKLFPFELMQYRWGRRLIGGTFKYNQLALPIPPFWSNQKFTTAQAKCLMTETY